jgi:hypothetical protein
MKRLLFVICLVSIFFLFSCQEGQVTFNVIYHGTDSTSGYPPTDDNEYPSGSTATVLGRNTLVKDGNRFNGWSTSLAGSGTLYQPGETIQVERTIFLFATWVPGSEPPPPPPPEEPEEP